MFLFSLSGKRLGFDDQFFAFLLLRMSNELKVDDEGLVAPLVPIFYPFLSQFAEIMEGNKRGLMLAASITTITVLCINQTSVIKYYV